MPPTGRRFQYLSFQRDRIQHGFLRQPAKINLHNVINRQALIFLDSVRNQNLNMQLGVVLQKGSHVRRQTIVQPFLRDGRYEMDLTRVEVQCFRKCFAEHQGKGEQHITLRQPHSTGIQEDLLGHLVQGGFVPTRALGAAMVSKIEATSHTAFGNQRNLALRTMAATLLAPVHSLWTVQAAILFTKGHS